jgi:Protein of unknown function (DUF3025)
MCLARLHFCRMKPLTEWNSRTLLRSPLFVPLHPVIAPLGSGDFPLLDDCNALLAARQIPVVVQDGLPLRFVAQEPGRQPFEAQYEPRCYLKGEVQTREHNWHDLFNALVWLTFPRAKAAINARHYRAMIDASAGGINRRGAVRDMSTLFDESGVAVVYSDTELAALLRDFQWRELFWQRRERVSASMGFYLFGHGLYEKAMRPYVGLTGQGLLLKVEQRFFDWPLEQRLAHLDGLLADYLNAPQHCRNTRELHPVPLLGVPGWAAENESEAFYGNTDYFRSGRRG